MTIFTIIPEFITEINIYWKSIKKKIKVLIILDFLNYLIIISLKKDLDKNN